MLYKEKPEDFSPKYNVVGCFVMSGNKILLLLREADRKWGAPAGKVEDREELKEAMKRELREETGVEADPEFVKTYYVRYPSYDFTFNTYKVLLQEQEIELSGEHSDYGWFTPEEAMKLNLIMDMKECIQDFIQL